MHENRFLFSNRVMSKILLSFNRTRQKSTIGAYLIMSFCLKYIKVWNVVNGSSSIFSGFRLGVLYVYVLCHPCSIAEGPDIFTNRCNSKPEKTIIGWRTVKGSVSTHCQAQHQLTICNQTSVGNELRFIAAVSIHPYSSHLTKPPTHWIKRG